MSETITTDLCVIGGGAAGLSVAAGAARLGVPVVLIERGAKDGVMGGDCLHTGCVPSKTLLATANAAQAMRDATSLALPSTDPKIDWRDVQARIRTTIATIAPVDTIARYRAMGVHVIEASARFTGRDSLRAGDTIVRARRFVIATGATPVIPPIPGIETVRALTSETIFDVDALPSHLLILGAGPIGLELGQAFRRLGSAVTILEAGHPLASEDEEMSRPPLDGLRRDGIALHPHTAVQEAAAGEQGGVRLRLGRGGRSEWIAGSHLLLAVGRAPRIDDLSLEDAGVTFNKDGICVGADLRTTNRRIFAIGDVIDGPRYTHVGAHQAGLVLRSALFRLPARFVPRAMPRVTYTQPQLAAVGLDEKAAQQKHRALRILRVPFADFDRAQTDGAPTGLLKIVATPRGKVLGAAIVGDRADELLTPWTLAVTGRLSLRDLAQMVVPYPTLSEATRKAALDFYAPAFDRPLIRRVLRWLRQFG